MRKSAKSKLMAEIEKDMSDDTQMEVGQQAANSAYIVDTMALIQKLKP